MVAVPAALEAAPAPCPGAPVACFSVHAPAEPSLMPRVIGVFARRGLVPGRWHSAVVGAEGGEMQIDLQVALADEGMRDRIAANLRALVGVQAVLVSLRSALAERPAFAAEAAASAEWAKSAAADGRSGPG